MSEKIILVTGANSGIGKEACLEMAKQGHHIIMACRNKARGQAALDEIKAAAPAAKLELLILDLGDLSSVREAAKKMHETHHHLDVLLNNAGVWMTRREVTPDGFEMTFGVNHLGHFLFTLLLEDLLEASDAARVVNVSSKLHTQGKMNWSDLQAEKKFGGTRAYNQSKLANVLFTTELSRRWSTKNITVNAVHPGIISTSLVRGMGSFSRLFVKTIFSAPNKGAAPLVRLSIADDVKDVTGKYFDKMKQNKAAKQARNLEDAQRLWNLSEEMVGIRE